MNDDQLSLLSKTIASHAREMAGKEWHNEHKPILLQILVSAGLDNLDEAMLSLHDRDVPIKVVVNAIHEQFLKTRTKILTQAAAQKIVQDAMRTAINEES
jgi:hypothetical protein